MSDLKWVTWFLSGLPVSSSKQKFKKKKKKTKKENTKTHYPCLSNWFSEAQQMFFGKDFIKLPNARFNYLTWVSFLLEHSKQNS